MKDRPTMEVFQSHYLMSAIKQQREAGQIEIRSALAEYLARIQNPQTYNAFSTGLIRQDTTKLPSGNDTGYQLLNQCPIF